MQVPEPEVEPVVSAEEPGLVVIGDEPLQEAVPEPTPAAAPVKKVVVKKRAAAPVKAAPVKKAAAPKKTLPAWVDPKGTVCRRRIR